MNLPRRLLASTALAALATLALAARAEPPAALGSVTVACPPKLAAYTDGSTAFSVRFAEAALSGAAFDGKARSLQCTYGPSPAEGLVSIEQNVAGAGCEVKMRNKIVCGGAAPVSLPVDILPVKSPAQPGWSVLYGMLSLSNVKLEAKGPNATLATATYKAGTYAKATQVLPASAGECTLSDAARGVVTCKSR
jgi:hypothetical protein